MNDHGETVPARDPFLSRLLVVVGVVALAALLATLAVVGMGVILATFGGILLAVALHGVSGGIARRTPLGYGWALLIIMTLILLLLGGGLYLLGAQIAQEADAFAQMLPQAAADAQQWLQQYAWGQWLLEQVGAGGGAAGAGGAAGQDGGGDEGSGGSGGGLSGGVQGGLAALGSLSNAFSYLLVVVFVGMFAASKPKLYVDGVVALTPLRHRGLVREVLGELGHTLRWWLIGQGAAMVLIGVSTMVMLWLFGVPFALVIGLIVGLLGFIPYVGPIVGLVPVTVVAATQGGDTLLYVLVAYFGVQMVEGYIITPLIQEQTVYLPPAFTVFMQILLGAVLGVMGVILATPLAAVTLVMSRFYRRDVLGDPEAEVRQE
jgi:predicted PurR-regulated permease PerM